MPTSKTGKSGGDSIQLIAKRNDGSIRQVLVQNTNGDVIAKGYFPPGTFMKDADWLKKRCFHWIDSFSDEELLDPANELIFDQEMINKLREESILANINKTFVDESIEKYKKVNQSWQ
jgi:hypothetical protein